MAWVGNFWCRKFLLIEGHPRKLLGNQNVFHPSVFILMRCCFPATSIFRENMMHFYNLGGSNPFPEILKGVFTTYILYSGLKFTVDEQLWYERWQSGV